ncbi:chemotaxis protein CheW [Methylocystis sp. WRRC1]|uniref:chemotaxis protein CheA n=1 Tax=Methylocystis sp. WRRC1 TaxID=1732014 RepID=UPI001D14CA78|nr:chemotaxis protein CheW [Methylocystis sp. WRRC1]
MIVRDGEAQSPGAEALSAAQANSQLRVSAKKVGRLMDLVGELSLSVSETIRSPDIAGVDLSNFEKSAHRLQLVVREVQEAAAELRLVPIGDVFRRMGRLVRELERQTGKEVDLEIHGEETEIDKMVVDRLFEPLVHLVRNSVDHGLESPDDRVAAGKPRRGRVTLAAAQVGGDIQITISDDGRGLDRARILQRARERGFFGADEEPEDADLWKVVFKPGFSTAETVTNLSGRGVGMDVLDHTMKALRGRISIDSVWERGARVVLAIPLSLAFLDSLVMRVGERLYATPIGVVAEIFRPDSGQVTILSAQGGIEVVKVRDALIPICRLDEFYGERNETRTPLERQIIVVFHTSRGRIGLPVDEMFDQQQVVMKPLQGHLERIRASFGCALLGTGEVAIMLDCEKLREGAAA